MAGRPQLRIYRLLLYFAVAVLAAGSFSLGVSERLTAVGVYLALGLVAIAFQRDPAGSQPRLWLLSLACDLAAHAWLVFRFGGEQGPFVLLFALPILLWGVLRGLDGGMAAATGTIGALVLQSLALRTFDTRAIASLSFHATAFLLLGGFAGLLGRRVAQEAAAHQQTRAELAQLRQEAASIVTTLSSGILCLDAEGRVRLTNAHARALLSDATLTPGTELTTLAAQPKLGRLGAFLHTALEQGSRMSAEVLLDPGALTGPEALQVDVSPNLGPKGEIRGLVVLLADISEKRQREAEEKRRERLAWIGQLSAGLAHEIRNSLKPITGSVELLRGELPESPSRAKTLMEIILREAENLEAFLSEFLSFARDKSLQVGPLALERVVEEEAASLSALSGRTVQLSLPTDESRNLGALCDRAALGQILRNLGLNALDASSEDRAVVIGYRAIGGEVEVFVRDWGSGIPSNLKDRVFDPFFTTKAHGTGLGLAIAHDLAERQGGRLLLETAPEGGTRAILRLRRATAMETPWDQAA